MRVGVIIVCAGSGERLGGRDKLRLCIGGKPILLHSLEVFLSNKAVKQIVVVVGEKNIAFVKGIASSLLLRKSNISIVRGGKERQDSVKNGLMMLDDCVDHVLIHDGARPFVSGGLLKRMLSALRKNKAVICALRTRDTLKQIDRKNVVIKTFDRSSVVSVQTPQGFKKDLIIKAYKNWRKKCSFDDAQAVEKIGVKIKVIEGELNNFKITYPEDLRLAKMVARAGSPIINTGFGFDTHRICKEKKPLVLAGVKVKADFNLRAVSDGDVVLHAMADALCGAACLGDIGDHFPPENKISEGIDSRKIVKFVLKKVDKKYRIVNIDVTIIAERPRLVKYKKKMTESLRKIFSVKKINVKIKSKEGLDILGGKNAICSMAVASVKLKNSN